MGVVYFVRIGKHVKIGFTTNLESRMSAFRNACVWPELMFTIPGGREVEKRIHGLLEEQRAERELFHPDARINNFIAIYQNMSPERAWQYLEDTIPKRREELAELVRIATRKRVNEARRAKKDRIDAICAASVERRKAARAMPFS